MRTHAANPAANQYRPAISIHFLIDGIGFGVWAALLPSLQSRLGISDSELSVILLAMIIGAVVAMALAGRLIGRYGSRAALRLITPLFCITLFLPAIAPNYISVAVAAGIFGGMKGSLDVSVNTHIIFVEKAIGRVILSSAQALWSIGGVVAALLVGLGLKAGGTPIFIMTGSSLLLLALWACFQGKLLGDTAREATVDAGPDKPIAKKPSALWGIGIVAFLALFAEGVMMDWSAIYSERVANAAVWLAPFAYGVFCAAMAAGRLGGDALITRLGHEKMLNLSSYLTAAGLLVIVLFHFWPITFVGLLAAGLGLSNLVPIFLAAAGRAQPHAVGQAVAKVSMIGYTGFLAGPPAIGFLSAWVGLPGAFCLVILMAFCMGVWGKTLLRSPAARNP